MATTFWRQSVMAPSHPLTLGSTHHHQPPPSHNCTSHAKMPTLQQPLPLNHPPPQLASQPPRKKLRSRNAKPKLTLEQITDHEVVQSALRIGRRARTNAPKPGEEPQALDKLLNRMEGWARQVAPQYSLAEFVVAAQGIAGNRELRPMLGVFRLAELREVTGDDGPEQKKDQDNGDQGADRPGLVDQPVAGPIQADVGPVRADVGPDDDEWDELDIVPDEAIEVRPARNIQAPSPDPKKDTKQNDELSPELEAKIEQNRLAAIERRKAVMARLSTENDASPTERSAGAQKNDLIDADTPSIKAPETEKQATEAKSDEHPQHKENISEGAQQSRDTSGSKKISVGTGNDNSQKPKSMGANTVKSLPNAFSEEKGAEVRTVEKETSTTKEDKGMEARALQQTDSPKRVSQVTDCLEDPEEQKGQIDRHSGRTKQNRDFCNDKADLPDLKKSTKATGASSDEKNEDIDISIMAEFEAAAED